MSKNLKEEQDKYTDFLENIQQISEGREEEFKKALRQEGQEISQNLARHASFSGLKKLVQEVEAETPEETETLVLLRSKAHQRLKLYACLGCAASSSIALIYSDMLKTKWKVVMSLMGIYLGGIYSQTVSNKEMMRRLEALGPEYQLSRIARDEALQWNIEPNK
ncbi:unnamed protein product [Blepharisma stoltei]|uniref:Uncharacterized protein n=1 Tax=Blepharisma stoltei TaxID=1481888 RepID=A0AAU9IGI6_9CILI|nr:unnamed protein product [Blepharisma stoltei]